MEHTCNAYCGADGEHCDLFYCEPGAAPEDLAEALAHYLGLHVTHCEPAREAPDNSGAPCVLAGDRAEATAPWLAWWR